MLEARKARRGEIRTKLHAARPVRSQLKAAKETRDHLCRSHLTLSEELHGLKIIVQNKEQELDALAKDVSKAMVAVTMQQIIKEEDDTAGTAAPSTPETKAPIPLVQWAAGCAMAWSPSARQAFELWLSAQPAPATVHIGSDAEGNEKEPPAAGTPVGSVSAGPVYVRAISARSDPYGGNPSNQRAGRQWTASEDGSRADGSGFHSEVGGTAGHRADI